MYTIFQRKTGVWLKKVEANPYIFIGKVFPNSIVHISLHRYWGEPNISNQAEWFIGDAGKRYKLTQLFMIISF